MKKLTSTLIIAVLCFSSTVSLFAQQNAKNSIVSPGDAQSAKLLNSFSALADGSGGAWLEWETGRENEIVGFYVYRVGGAAGGGRQLVSPALIPAEFLMTGQRVSSGRKYNYFDPQGGASTRYIIESVDARGRRQSSRTFAPRPVADLTDAAGASSEELRRRAASASPSAEKSDLEIPSDLLEEMTEAAKLKETYASKAAESEPNATQKWIAAQPGAKIGVRFEGLYRVTRAQLQNAGFDVNASNALWQLYADGVEQPLIVGPNGDYIEFYGRGLDTPESDTRMYYLVVGAQPGKRMDTTVFRAIGAPVAARSYQQFVFKKDRFTYLSQILNGEIENFFGALITSNGGGNTTVNLPAVDTSAATARVEVAVQGFSYIIHNYRILLNGTEIGTMTGINTDLMTGAYTVPVSLLNSGANTVRVEALNPNDLSFTESVKISYARRYEAEQDRLWFYTPNYRQTRVSGFTSPDIRAFDMTDAGNPKEILNLRVRPAAAGGGYELVLPSYRGRVVYAAAGGGVRAPASVTGNAPSTLSTPQNAANMVIISYRDWMNEAENWANYRRADGLTVKLVNVEDIYDEFGFGVATAESIRGFLQYAKNNWQTAPGYVLLIGDASYDPRNHLGFGFLNYVPAKIVDTTFTQTGSDDALADFNDDGLAELAVGRIPIRNAAGVTTILAKTTAFEQNLASAPSRGALCASDLPRGYDFQALCSRIFQSFPGTAGVPQSHLNRVEPDSRSLLLNAVSQGKYIVNYSGHGTLTAWEGNWYSSADVPSLTNSNANLTLWIMLTCLNGYYVEPSRDGLAEALIKKTEGGAVASWTSSGETTPDIQEIMAKRFYDQIATNATMKRVGDFVNDSKTTIPGGRDVRLSWVLLGDPALKIKP